MGRGCALPCWGSGAVLLLCCCVRVCVLPSLRLVLNILLFLVCVASFSAVSILISKVPVVSSSSLYCIAYHSIKLSRKLQAEISTAMCNVSPT